MNPEGDIHSFLFADLVGFTALTAAHGDAMAAEVAVEFASSVRMLAADHGVQFVKAMGDAVMVHGSSAAETVQLGLRLAHDRPGAASRPPVRIAVHSGPAVGRDGDWYGTAVNVTSRLAACAAPGQLLVTEDTGCRVARRLAVELVDQGLRWLRDVPAPVHVFVARPQPVELPRLRSVRIAAAA